MDSATLDRVLQRHIGRPAWRSAIDLLIDHPKAKKLRAAVVNDDGTIRIVDLPELGAREQWLWQIIRSLLGDATARPDLEKLEHYDLTGTVGQALLRATATTTAHERWLHMEPGPGLRG